MLPVTVSDDAAQRTVERYNTGSTQQYHTTIFYTEWCYAAQWYYPTVPSDGTMLCPTVESNGGTAQRYCPTVPSSDTIQRYYPMELSDDATKRWYQTVP